MKSTFIRAHYELHAEIMQTGDMVSLNIYSVWPKARTDRSPHRILNLNLPKDAMECLGEFVKSGGCHGSVK
jgi:hypothetical protein